MELWKRLWELQQLSTPGKGVGKGLNKFYDDYWSAWGDEQWNYGGNAWEWEQGWSNGGDMGNISMLLESGKKERTTKTTANSTSGKQKKASIGEVDALTNTRRREAVPKRNRFNALIDNDDGDDDNDTHDDAQVTNNAKRQNPNRRQRKQRQYLLQLALNKIITGNALLCDEVADGEGQKEDDEVVRDAAASDVDCEGSEIGVEYNGWCPGPEHCGGLASRHDNNNKCGMTTHDTSKRNDRNQFNFITTTTTTCGPSAFLCTSNCNCSHSFQSLATISSSSSQQPHNWSISSGVSAATDPSTVGTPHGWQLRGVDAREVMSPRQETPAAKLVPRPGLLCQHQAQVPYSTHEGVRASLAFPSTCTRPSGYIPGGSQGGVRALRRTELGYYQPTSR